MIAKSVLGAIALIYLATSGVVSAEKKKKKSEKKGSESKAGKASVNVNKDVIEHVTVTPNEDGTVVLFTAHEGYSIEKVFEGSTFITKFNLEAYSPKSVTKHMKNGKIYVTAAVENALHLAYKKDGDKYEEMPIIDFYEEVLLKGREVATVDLEKLEGPLFTVTTFGSGKKHTFSSEKKRVGKLVADDDTLIKGEEEFVTELCVFVGGEKSVARVVYLYKGDSRIKEVFFQKTEEGWTRVEVDTAAEILHSIDSTFSADYKTIYDGFSAYSVFFAVLAIAFSTVF
ncbi:ema family member protein [Theileria equi strain WA]|uniref:Ema family member protein n=1 Tax=Theileria equi strain WA TaxID=1537102 RepID=L1LFM7_THEEQ|nr:ema family member protein [Theileria equi strain WA]EKX74232.1 ema family member protein [Theileria equi strain WA]|eukprot:XP_004833684.1 ema family member protein [Theileria equi strain WA]